MKQFNLLLIFLLLFTISACTPRNLSYIEAQQRNNRKLETEAQRNDADFLLEAANYNLFFTSASDWASQQAYSRMVADFAKTALMEHRSIEEDLKKLAKDKKMALPTQMSERHQQLMNELNATDQRTIDRLFLNTSETLYDRAVRLFEDAALKAHDSNIRAFAASKLDILRANERKADELENQLL